MSFVGGLFYSRKYDIASQAGILLTPDKEFEYTEGTGLDERSEE